MPSTVDQAPDWYRSSVPHGRFQADQVILYPQRQVCFRKKLPNLFWTASLPHTQHTRKAAALMLLERKLCFGDL
jgi:hypothetical protein